jgi:hypothetical protein
MICKLYNRPKVIFSLVFNISLKHAHDDYKLLVKRLQICRHTADNAGNNNLLEIASLKHCFGTRQIRNSS